MLKAVLPVVCSQKHAGLNLYLNGMQNDSEPTYQCNSFSPLLSFFPILDAFMGASYHNLPFWDAVGQSLDIALGPQRVKTGMIWWLDYPGNSPRDANYNTVASHNNGL